MTSQDPTPTSASRAHGATNSVAAYSATAQVYDQIAKLGDALPRNQTLLLAVTGGVWTVATSPQLELPSLAVLGMLFLHGLGSLAMLQYSVTLVYAIRQRFEFRERFGRKFYPDINKLGGEAFSLVYGGEGTIRSKYFRWGRPAVWLWCILPCGAFLGSGLLFYLRMSAG